MAGELTKIPHFNEIATLYSSGQLPMPFVQEIYLTKCEIAGTGYVENIEEKSALLSEGSEVRLVREPDNKYDFLAIRIDNENGEKLGYIPRRKNEILARLLDGGKILYGKVAGVETFENSKWMEITIRIFMKDL